MKYTTLKNRLNLLLLTLLTCTITACQQNNKAAKTATSAYAAEDARGKIVELDQEAQRVVVLFRPMVDAVFMLQANEKLVGIPDQIYEMASGFAFFSKIDPRIAKKEIPTPTFGGGAASMESIVGLAPDLVIAYDQDQEVIQQLEDLHIPVYAVSCLNKEKIFAEFKGIAKLLGKEDRADKLIHLVQENLSGMEVPEGQKRKRVYYGWSNGRILSTSGQGTLVDLVIKMGGAENVCPFEMEAPNVGAESIYRWNPDLILLWNSVPEDVYKLKELAALPAVKNKAVYVLSPSFNFDPHTLKFMLFAKQVHQWCYGDGDEEQLQKDTEEIIQQLYN